MNFTLVAGEDLPPSNQETILEKIERLEYEIESLKEDVENERQRADEAFDESETARKELEEAEDKLSDMEDWIDPESDDERLKNDEDDTALCLIQEMRTSYERLRLGVNTEIDNIISLTDKLLELHK